MTYALTEHHDDLRATALRELRHTLGMRRSELDAWQLELLNEQLAHAYERSPFYRSRRHRWGLPRDLQNLDVLARFPFTTKGDLRDHYPFGFLAAPRAELIRYGESTGTTGRPTSAFIGYEDWIRGNVWVEHALRHHFTPDDSVFIAIPYELTFASYDIDRAFEAIGATVVPVGTLNQICPFPRLVDMMAAVHPTSLVCTPTRAYRLLNLLVERGHDPNEVGLQTLLYVGETCAPAKLAKIAAAWKVQLITAYGSTETNSLALPCELGSLHLVEARHFFEVVNPVAGRRVPPGELGELVLTSLRTRAMPLIRYRTGDYVRVLDEPCACGNPARVLEHHGRVCEGVQVGDRVIPKLHLEQAILSVPGTGVYYATGAREGTIHVRVEVADAAEQTCEAVAESVRATFDVPAVASPVSRQCVLEAMDRMLKPGSLDLGDLEASP